MIKYRIDAMETLVMACTRSPDGRFTFRLAEKALINDEPVEVEYLVLDFPAEFLAAINTTVASAEPAQ